MLLNNAVSQLFFDNVDVAVVDSDIFALPAQSNLITWQYWFDTDPSVFTVQMLISVDGIHFNVVDLDSSVAGNINAFVTSAPFIMARVSSATGGAGLSLSVISKPVSYPAQNAGSNVLVRRVILTNDQIIDLANTPVEIVPNKVGFANIPVFVEIQPVFVAAYSGVMSNPAAFAAGFGFFSTDGGDFLSGPFENPSLVNLPGSATGLTDFLENTWAEGDVTAHLRIVSLGGMLGTILAAGFTSDILVALELDTTHQLTGGDPDNYLVIDVFYVSVPVS